MILHLYYNANVLDVTHGQHELGLGYVDDMAFVVAAKSFREAHRILGNMMSCPEGGNAWSLSHNSRFEASKSILVDFSHSKGIECPPMRLGGTRITPQPVHKFLGVMLDQELRWSQQANSALAKSTKLTLAFWRLAKSFSGVNLRLMWQLYHVVTVPKILYTVDVWLTPVHQKLHARKSSGSVSVVMLARGLVQNPTPNHKQPHHTALHRTDRCGVGSKAI